MEKVEIELQGLIREFLDLHKEMHELLKTGLFGERDVYESRDALAEMFSQGNPITNAEMEDHLRILLSSIIPDEKPLSLPSLRPQKGIRYRLERNFHKADLLAEDIKNKWKIIASVRHESGKPWSYQDVYWHCGINVVRDVNHVIETLNHLGGGKVSRGGTRE